MDNRDFLTFPLMNVKHTVLQRPQTLETVKPNKERQDLRQLGLSDNSIVVRSEGISGQLCGESNVAD